MAIDLRAAFGEFLAMFFFVFICVGTATGVAGADSAILQISLTFGFCITALAYALGHRSGAQINCAVTFGLMAAGALDMIQGLVNFGAQMLGSTAAAMLLALIKEPGNDATKGFGTNAVANGFEWYQALIAEVVGTFLLMYVVLETAVADKSKDNRLMAAVAIGLAVFLAHSFLIPIDGCSINPTRSFGPALVYAFRDTDPMLASRPKVWEDMWIFWVGPILGSMLAVLVFKFMNAGEDSSDSKDMETNKSFEAGADDKL